MENDFLEPHGNHRFNSSRSEEDFTEIEDPISAYFKQRCDNSTKAYFTRFTGSESESSFGCIDVDNVSLFDDEKENENFNITLTRNSFPAVDKFKNANVRAKYSDVSSMQSFNSSTGLEKQRVLAQRALMKINNKFSSTDESQVKDELQKSQYSTNVFSNLVKESEPAKKQVSKNWFEANSSCTTPRYFKDELSSCGDEELAMSLENESQKRISLREKNNTDNKRWQSQYVKQINSILKEINQLQVNSDKEFETYTAEEQCLRLEEDEKKFQLENSPLSHNSRISQFSETTGYQWSPAKSNKTGDQTLSQADGQKLSIGQFFNMRSNRVSSLLGSDSKEQRKSVSQTVKEETKNTSKHEQSLPLSNSSKLNNLKPRRCVSTFDLVSSPEFTVSRYSNDSSTSNSTVLIQNILAEMESGLSGTQIYEKLMKGYVTKKNAKDEPKVVREKQKSDGLGTDTPKSSKIQKRTDNYQKSSTKQVQENNIKMEPKNLRELLDHQKSSIASDDCKENENDCDENDCNYDQSISVLRHEKIKLLKGKKGFDASTPKMHNGKAQNQNDEFRSSCNKVLMKNDDWEAPRVSAIQPTIEFNRTASEDCDRTLVSHSNSTFSCVEPNKKSSTANINDTLTIEDTIIAGDLTVLSQRIEELKEDGVCIVRSTESEEPVLLTVVQKLADLPKGSIDCSALTPLLRDQFPELLSTFPTSANDKTLVNGLLTPPSEKSQDFLLSQPGSWVKLPAQKGFQEKIYSFAEVKKNIFIPFVNVSKSWLLVSVDSLTMISEKGQKLVGTKKNDEWFILEFLTLFMKDTIIPPNSQQSIQISVVPKIPIKIDLKLTFVLKQLLGKEVQSRNMHIRIHCINPLYSLNVIPKDAINFGVIADQCFDQRTVQLSFDGICELPLIVYIEEENSQAQHFFLKPSVPFCGNQQDWEWRDEKFQHYLQEGEKQVLDFLIFFQPNTLIVNPTKTQDFKAQLVVKIGNDIESDGVLQKIPIKGSVSFAKFLCNSSCSPLVFRVAERGQSLTRSFPLKNVGSLPIAFSIKLENEETKNEARDNIFVAPKSFYLSRNEESAIDVTFNANTNENCVKRLMTLQIKPNGRAKYEVELIGIISQAENRPVSRASNASGSTKSVTSSESVPIKLMTTTQSLSWPCVPLEKDMKQTFSLKNASSCSCTARISFKSNLGSFKFVNEDGEKVQKMRKVLKPDCPYTVTVVFRPDSLGPHHNTIFIETNRFSGKKMVSLSGIGGMPNLFIGNVKSDLNGCKMVVLQNTSTNNQSFFNKLEFKNGGRIPGFIVIKPGTEVLSLSHELSVSPSSCVIQPDTKIVVKLSQKLKNDDLRQLLSGKDISKIATLSIIMGDEHSRLRLRKLIQTKKIATSDRLRTLISSFEGEREINIQSFEDTPAFEHQFLKSLKVLEVAVVVERSAGICEPTILIDEDETLEEFVTICSAAESTVASTIILQDDSDGHIGNSKNSTICSLDSPPSAHNKITKWLDTVDYHANKP